MQLSILQYKAVEDWEHIIKCRGVDKMKTEYLKELKEKLVKIAVAQQEHESISMIILDLEAYLCDKNHEYYATQQYIGFNLVFGG